MMSRRYGLRSELSGAIAKKLPHAKNQLSALGSFFNQFFTDIFIYTHINRVLIVKIIVYNLLILVSIYICEMSEWSLNRRRHT